MIEAVQTQLREVGIELELEEADLVAVVQPKVRDRRANWYIRGGVPSKKAVEPQIAALQRREGRRTLVRGRHDLQDVGRPAPDLRSQGGDAQLRKIGNYKFENFEVIPLFDVYIEVVVNPKIIKDWPFSGWDGGDIGHTFLISACKQEKPCK